MTVDGRKKMSEGNNSFHYGNSVNPPESTNTVNTDEVKPKKPYKLPGIILTVIAIALAAVIFAIVNESYTVSNIIINGSAPYTEEQLRTLAMDYCNGKNSGSYFYVDEGELAEKLYMAFPYLKNVTVEKNRPDTLIITVEGEEAQAYFFMIDAYYIVNEGMKVLERVTDKPTLPTLIELSISTPKEVILGKPVVFSDGISIDTDSFVKLYNAITENSLRYDVVSIKAESKFDLGMTLRSGTDIKIGSVKDVEDKISGLKKWMDENPSMLGPRVNIDITIIKKISITYD